MPRFAANLSMLFTEVPFLERFDRAARAGFGSVEFLFPYAHTPGEVAAKLKGNRLSLVLHNLPAGDWDAGERGIACLPDRVDEFRAGVARAVEYATALGAPQLNCLAGKLPLGELAANPGDPERPTARGLGVAVRWRLPSPQTAVGGGSFPGLRGRIGRSDPGPAVSRLQVATGIALPS